jgi:hypothetical protein
MKPIKKSLALAGVGISRDYTEVTGRNSAEAVHAIKKTRMSFIGNNLFIFNLYCLI